MSRILLMMMFCLVGGLLTEAAAQGVCVPPTLEIGSLRGMTIRTYSQGEESLEGAKITLHKKDSHGPVVARTIADSAGKFAFKTKRTGQYVLVVEKPHYITFVFPVRLSTTALADKTQQIVINLGANYNDSCGGGFAEIRHIDP